MMFRFHGSAGLSECGSKSVHMQSVGEKRNEYTFLFLYLVQYGARSQCPSVCFKDFFMTFLKRSFMLTSTFNSTVQSIPCQSNNMQKARQCWVKSCWFCCVLNCIKVHSAVQLQGETLQPQISQNHIRNGLWNTFIGRRRHVFSEWMATLIMTDCITHTNFTQWTNNTNHCPTTTCSPQVYMGSELIMTNRATQHQ